jgi:DNA-binding SARP family transcriptional activator
MNLLSIKLLGTFELKFERSTTVRLPYEKVKALLAYLAAEPNCPHHRDVLADFFWPDRSSELARANLRKAITNLRTIFDRGQSSENFKLIATRQTIELNYKQPAQIDLIHFQELTHGYYHQLDKECHLCAVAIASLEAALSLYQGEFLSSLRLYNNDVFDDWLQLKRQQIHQQAIDVCLALLNHYRKQLQWESALKYARKLIELEPWNELGHELVMKILLQTKKRNYAVLHYENYAHNLRKHLDMEPEPSVKNLYQEIKSGIA